MASQDAYGEIAAALNLYFDGLYEGSVDKMKQIFHPQCRLYALQEGSLRSLTMDDYYPTILARPSPQSLRQPRIGRVLSLSASNGDTASATVRTARLPRIYTDYLHLLRLDGRWQIVAKTYSWKIVPEEKK